MVLKNKKMSLPILLLVLTFVVAVLGLIVERYFKDRVPSWLFIVFIAILSVSLVAAVYQQRQDDLSAQYAATSGKLSGGLENKTITYPILKVGTAEFVWKGPEGGPMFVIGNDPITVWIENGELKVNLTLRDQSGSIVTKIVANEWQVNPNLIFDKNFDDKSFEVIDVKGDVVLQMVFDGTSVQFCGKFYQSDGRRIGIGNNVIEIRLPGQEMQLTFAPIFKYPSSEYPGQKR
jgi:hypothetical protein